MTSIRRFQKKKLKEQNEWQRGGFRAHPEVLKMRRLMSNNRKWTIGRIAEYHRNRIMEESGSFMGKLRRSFN